MVAEAEAGIKMFGRSYWQIAFLVLLVLVPIVSMAISFGVQDEQWLYDNPGRSHHYLIIVTVTFFTSIGLLFYILRENARIVFGVLEVMFSVIFFRSALTVTDNILRTFLQGGVGLVSAIAFILGLCAAAIYIFLNGLDNIGRGLSGHPRLMKAWRWLTFRPVNRDQ